MKTAFWSLASSLILACGISYAEQPTLGMSRSPVGPTIGGAPTADLVSLMRRQGLFDPSRLTTSRSYSFGISSGGGTTTSAGLLVQHIQYQISTPLTLRMDVGLLHNPLGLAGFRNGPQQASLVIPAIDLIYRPRDNMVLSVHYSQMPSGRNRNPLGYDSFGYEADSWWTHPNTGW
jgi:hypothetical protein